jgi:hypothetical protein
MNAQMTQSILVEVPAAEFAKKYRGMVMLLQEISKHGDKEYPLANCVIRCSNLGTASV